MRKPLEIRVLSLASSTDRRSRVTGMLAELDTPAWSFYDAQPYDKDIVAYEPAVAFKAYGSVLSHTELSCATSHLGIIIDFFYRNEADYLLILEDDVQIDPFFRMTRASDLMRELEVDYLKLFTRTLSPSKFIGNVGAYMFYRANWPPLGCQCFALSRAGAEKLIDTITCGPLRFPIDVALDRYWETGLPIVLMYPFPLMELALPTTIHQQKPIAAKDADNSVLRKKHGTQSSVMSVYKDKLAKRVFDHGLKRFDRNLAARIESKNSNIYNILYR